MIASVTVVGRGRAGSAIAARLRERGLELEAGQPELVLLCVPDSAISEVAARTPVGPWVAHVSGATPLSALEPHTRRFSVHPLQTLVRSRGPEQLDGAYGGVTAETPAARERALWLAGILGLVPFDLADDMRPLYHAGRSARFQLSGDPLSLGRGPLRDGSGPSRSPHSADAAHHGERVRADRPNRQGRLGYGRTAPGGPSSAPPDLEPVYRVLAEATRP